MEALLDIIAIVIILMLRYEQTRAAAPKPVPRPTPKPGTSPAPAVVPSTRPPTKVPAQVNQSIYEARVTVKQEAAMPDFKDMKIVNLRKLGLSEEIATITVEIERINWSKKQGSAHLQKTYELTH